MTFIRHHGTIVPRKEEKTTSAMVLIVAVVSEMMKKKKEFVAVNIRFDKELYKQIRMEMLKRDISSLNELIIDILVKKFKLDRETKD